MQYYFDYPSEPIGGKNPYYRCSSCKRSQPEINGKLDGHMDHCKWMQKKKRELKKEEE